MKEENSKYLIKRFPNLFHTFMINHGRHCPRQFAVGNGWYGILFDAFSELNRLIDNSDERIKVDFVQIKEKLGTLRMYYNCKIYGESRFSKCFRSVDEFVRTKMCKYRMYKIYWWMFQFRRKYIYETLFEKVGSIISYAEELSARICEICGATGERCIPRHWILTLCEKHKNEEESKKEWGKKENDDE